MCCRDGTPEQARHAVSTMASLLNPKSSALSQTQNDAFEPLLKSLTSPSRLSLSEKDSTKLVSILTALAELADHAPSLFERPRGKKALKFALESVLLGRAHTSSSDDNDTSESEDEADQTLSKSKGHRSPGTTMRRKSTPVAKRRSGLKNLTPGGNGSLLEDPNLSVSCRRLCASIEFVVSYIRSSVLKSKVQAPKDDDESDTASVRPAPDTIIQQTFDILSQLLDDHGLALSSQDRKDCKLRQDRAALRQYASVNLLRLCDRRLGLEKKYLSVPKWHTLSTTCLDDERVVREAFFEELGNLYTGEQKYGPGAVAPNHRFLALMSLCVDGDHGANHSAANGGAANVGKSSGMLKSHATKCVALLRKACEEAEVQAQALGREAELAFSLRKKPTLMPEYIVPFAFNLLAHRRETPSAGADGSTNQSSQTQEDETYEVDEGQHKILRKRLKCLFDPLVHSFGDSPDNISFLLRMTEMIGKNFRPLFVHHKSQGINASSPPSFRLSAGSESEDEIDVRKEAMAEKVEIASAKLKIICSTSREVLLSYVKKDINLADHPARILINPTLFEKIRGTKRASSFRSAPLSQPKTLTQSSAPTVYSPEISQMGRDGARLGASQEASEDSSNQSPAKRQRSVASLNSSQESSSQISERDARRLRRSQSTQGSSQGDSVKSLSMSTTLTPQLPSKRRTAGHARGSLESNNSRVHFSPEPQVRTIPPRRSQTSSTKKTDDPFDGISPIRNAGSPHSNLAPDSDEKTRGTTPPSALRGVGTISGTADVATEVESPTSRTSKQSNAVSERDDPNDPDGVHTTPETETSPEASPVAKKRASPDSSAGSSKRRKNSRGVPMQIKVSRPKPSAEKENNAAVPTKRRSSSRTRKASTTPSSSSTASSSSKPERDENNLDFMDDNEDGATSSEESEDEKPKRKNQRKGKKGGSKKPLSNVRSTKKTSPTFRSRRRVAA